MLRAQVSSRGPRALTLLATGTEVGLAVAAQARLAEVGIDAAVVSMPCWELFEAQDEAYRAEVLGTAPRIGVEAAMPFGWERWLRPGDKLHRHDRIRRLGARGGVVRALRHHR